MKNPDFFKQQIEEMYATEAGGFAPDVESELRKLEWCDLMVWQFPLWWFGLPGIMKGWVDRVLVMGRTYGGDGFTKMECSSIRRPFSPRPPADLARFTGRVAGTVISMPSCVRFSEGCFASSASRCLRPISYIVPFAFRTRNAKQPSRPGPAGSGILNESNPSTLVNTEPP